MTLREEFEKEFQVPSGVMWDKNNMRYVSTCNHPNYPLAFHASRFEAYQAAHAAQQKRVEELEAALRDMLSGWRYIRETHGDLYGVGWDRAQEKSEQALSATARENK